MIFEPNAYHTHIQARTNVPSQVGIKLMLPNKLNRCSPPIGFGAFLYSLLGLCVVVGCQEKSTITHLVVAATNIERTSSPVVDVHTHFFAKGKHDPDLLKRYVEMMDRNNIAVSVSLDGTLFLRLDEHCKFLWTEYRDRFVVFANIDFQGTGMADKPETWACNQPDFVRRIVEKLKEPSTREKISGLKIFKDFGLRYRNADGTLISIDDPRWDPIWQACGELGLPVLMHSADPAAFFEPITPANERFRELNAHPDWSFADSKFPKRKEVHDASAIGCFCCR